MSWAAVKRWRDRLRGHDVALDVALDALTDQALDAVAAMPGTPYASAAMAVARTVSTAPVEWCAVLLGRGTSLALKHPTDDPGLVPLLVEAARAEGLALSASADRAALRRAELVIAMGSDETTEAIRAEAAGAKVLGFGHRFSIAYVASPSSFGALADDVLLHDGLGCMSPVAVFTPLPLTMAADALANALANASPRIPSGPVAPAAAATLRTRRALARALGAVHEGEGWSVHTLPTDRFAPGALPRSVALHGVADVAELRTVLAPWARWLSTIGTDAPVAWPGVRVCPPGRMQRPPVVRLHDGVDWLRETLL